MTVNGEKRTTGSAVRTQPWDQARNFRGRCLALYFFAILILPFLLAPRTAGAGDEPFTFPSNIGLTGFLETPTARVMKENRYRVGATQARPYRTYFGTVGLFERLEVNARVTEVMGIPALTSGYGDYKDKAVDLKLQFLPEGKYTPAVALAIMDPHGTRLFPSQAIVVSKQIYPFDFTVGLGNGRFGKHALASQGEGFGMEMFENPRAWWRDAQLFGGVQFAVSDRFALVAEYSPIRYERQTNDPAQEKYFPGPVSSRINAGLRWKPTRWSEIDASWQRGNQVGVTASLSFDIGKPLVPIYDPPYREPPGRRQDPATDRIAAALYESGFSDVGVETDGVTLRVEAQNETYYFAPRAVEVIVEQLAPRLPGTVDYVRIRLKDNGMPLTEFVTTRAGILGLSAGEITPERFRGLSTHRADADPARITETAHRKWLSIGARPTFETFLNDPSGFFKYRFGLSAWVNAYPWPGGTAVLGLEGYPVNNVSTSNAPLSIPVRSDIAEYKKEKIALGRLMAEQVVKTRDPLFARVAAGFLEVEYAGVDVEIAMPVFNGRILAGAGGSAVRKRQPDDPFRLKGDDTFHTAFLNGRLNLPEFDVHVDIKGGRFLAGDKGARVSVSKSINGVVLSAWYSFTGTSMFQDSYNRGYHDKGISVDIPIRLFTGRDSQSAYRYALSPWTRDVAQDVDHYRTLFDIIGRNVGVNLDRDAENLYKSTR